MELPLHAGIEDEDAFFHRVRSVTAHIPGTCVLDLCGANALRCSGFSSFDLTLNELNLVLPKEVVAEVLMVCAEHHVSDCFAVRNELVNFKKLCLHLYHEFQILDGSLRRFSSMFFCDVVNTSLGDPELCRYTKLCGATMHCKGHMRVLLDLREQCKYICSIPRHFDLDFAFPEELFSLPSSLGVAGLIDKAEAFVQEMRSRGCDEESVAEREDDISCGGETVHSDNDPLCVEDYNRLMSDVRTRCADLPAHVLLYLEKLFSARGAMKAMRIHTCARKLRTALKGLLRRARQLMDCFNVASGFRCVVRGVPVVEGSVKNRIHADMHGNILRGVVPALEEACVIMTAILSEPSERLFSIGDHLSGSLLRPAPAGSAARGELLSLLTSIPAEVAAVLKAAMADYAVLTSSPDWQWPPLGGRPGGGGRTAKVKATHRCHLCGILFAKIWLVSSSGCVGPQLHCCTQCEAQCRDRGQCPFDKALSFNNPVTDPELARKSRHRKHENSKGCPGAVAWCPHQKICFACEGGGAMEPGDGVGCIECRLVRGGGEAILALVRAPESTIRFVFLDFDQTLATTKRGENPLPLSSTPSAESAGTESRKKSRSKHSVDPYLRELCGGSGSLSYQVHVITRNQHKDAIVEFLVGEGCFVASGDVNLHILKSKSGASKLYLVNSILSAVGHVSDSDKRAEPVAVFADDSLVEILAGIDAKVEGVSTHGGLLRVLFSQGG